MESITDLETGVGDRLLKLNKEEVIALKESGDDLARRSSTDVAPPLLSTSETTSSSPLNRLIAYGRESTLYALACDKFEEWHVRDKTKRFLKLCGLTFMLIFVVMLSSLIMAFSHWFTIVFGHVFLHYTVPQLVDPTHLDYTMILAGVGAFIVNLPPLIVFLLTLPLTFDRNILERGTAAANELIKRTTPKNRYVLVFIKYAPRLAAAPIGSKIVYIIQGPEDNFEEDALDPLHAFLVGLVGEIVLTVLGRLKDMLTAKKTVVREPTAQAELPL